MRISDWSSDVCSSDLRTTDRVGINRQVGSRGQGGAGRGLGEAVRRTQARSGHRQVLADPYLESGSGRCAVDGERPEGTEGIAGKVGLEEPEEDRRDCHQVGVTLTFQQAKHRSEETHDGTEWVRSGKSW